MPAPKCGRLDGPPPIGGPAREQETGAPLFKGDEHPFSDVRLRKSALDAERHRLGTPEGRTWSFADGHLAIRSHGHAAVHGR